MFVHIQCGCARVPMKWQSKPIVSPKSRIAVFRLSFGATECVPEQRLNSQTLGLVRAFSANPLLVVFNVCQNKGLWHITRGGSGFIGLGDTVPGRGRGLKAFKRSGRLVLIENPPTLYVLLCKESLYPLPGGTGPG